MVFCITKLTFVFLTFVTGCISESPTKCVSLKLKPKLSVELTESQTKIEYYCPREFDPSTFTECCNNDGCCEVSLLPMAVNDEWLLMITSIVVICSCTILTVLVIICCFWSKCPLYNACRPNYNTNDVIVYALGKDDPSPLMPAESSGKGHVIRAVKIREMEEVV